MTSNKAVLGFVSSRANAEEIVSQLQRARFSNDDISALFPNGEGTQSFAHEQKTKAPEGAVVGVSTGGVVGGALGLLAGIGALAIPGVGPIIAAGPIMASLSGAAAGAAVGGLTGALVGMGIPEIEAKVYEGRVKGGHILLSVHTDDEDQRATAKKIMEGCGAVDIVTVGEKKSASASERHARN